MSREFQSPGLYVTKPKCVAYASSVV